MFENYEKQGPRAGYAVPYTIERLRNPDDTHPIIHLEHLGGTNTRWREMRLARAGTKAEVDPRDMLRCCARRLELAYKSDGTLATDADLPAFIEKIPIGVVESLLAFALDERNFCDYPIVADPEAIAKK